MSIPEVDFHHGLLESLPIITVIVKTRPETRTAY